MALLPSDLEPLHQQEYDQNRKCYTKKGKKRHFLECSKWFKFVHLVLFFLTVCLLGYFLAIMIIDSQHASGTIYKAVSPDGT